MVIESTDADAMAKVLVNARGLNSRPLSAAEHEDGGEADGNDQQTEEERWADFLGGIHDDVAAGAGEPPGAHALFFMIEMLVRVFDHDDRAIHDHADGDGDAAEAHDVGVDAEQMHRQQADQHAAGDDEDGDQRAARVQRKNMHTSATTSISSSSVCRKV